MSTDQSRQDGAGAHETPADDASPIAGAPSAAEGRTAALDVRPERPKPTPERVEQLEAACDRVRDVRDRIAHQVANPDDYLAVVTPTAGDWLALFDLVAALAQAVWPVRSTGSWRLA